MRNPAGPPATATGSVAESDVHPVSNAHFWPSVERQTLYGPLRSHFVLVKRISDEVPATASMIRPNPGSSTGCHVLASAGACNSTLTLPPADPMARKPSCVAIKLPIEVPSGIDAIGNGVAAADPLALGIGVALSAALADGLGVGEATASSKGSLTRPLPIAAAAPTVAATSNAAASRTQRADVRRRAPTCASRSSRSKRDSLNAGSGSACSSSERKRRVS